MPKISIPGDPAGLAGLASQLAGAADHVDEVHGRLAGEGLQGAWSGRAANAFRSSIDKLPGELATVVHAFGDASRALKTFSVTLGELQRKADWYNRQLETAEREQAEAEAGREHAQNELRAAKLRHDAATDPVSLRTAGDAVSYGEGLLSQAASHVEETVGRVAKLEAASLVLHEEYDRAVSTCCDALDAARHSGGHSILGAIGRHIKQIGGAIGHEAGVIWHGAKDLAEDFEHVGEDGLKALDANWGEWRKALVGFNNLIGDVAVDVSVGLLSLAAASFAIPVVGEAVAGTLLGAEGYVLKVAGGVQAIDSDLVFAGDFYEGVVRGRSEFKGYLGDDIKSSLVSMSGEKIVGTVVGKTGKELESVPVIRSTTHKLVSLAKHDNAVKTELKIAAEEGKIVEHKLEGGVDHVIDKAIHDVPRAIFSAPLEEPFNLRIPLLPVP